MNNSLVTADFATHLRVLAVSLIASILVVWIGISARLHASEALSDTPRLERLNSGRPALPAVRLENTGRSEFA